MNQREHPLFRSVNAGGEREIEERKKSQTVVGKNKRSRKFSTNNNRKRAFLSISPI
jgi:hypothetical protein